LFDGSNQKLGAEDRDPAGALLSRSTVDAAGTHTTNFDHDQEVGNEDRNAKGEIVKHSTTTHDDNGSHKVVYDANNKQTETEERNKQGEIVSRSKTSYDDKGANTVSFDAQNRVIGNEKRDASGKVQFTSSTTYGADGSSQEKQFDGDKRPLGVFNYKNDAEGHSELQSSTQYKYSDSGTLKVEDDGDKLHVEKTGPDGKLVEKYTEEFEVGSDDKRSTSSTKTYFDEKDREIATERKDGDNVVNSSKTEYADDGGKKQTLFDEQQRETGSVHYDKDGKVNEMSNVTYDENGNSRHETFKYDGDGQPKGSEVVQLDEQKRQIATESKDAIGKSLGSTKSTYDDDGQKYDEVYDASGQLISPP